ncbi:MAG: 3-hydroxyacyl-CoA dehydrogenase NAD-binding domain-containing protein [Nocardioidaceae bacterium]
MAWPSLEQLGLREGASRDRLRFTDTLEEALADADFVQESSPRCSPPRWRCSQRSTQGRGRVSWSASSTSGFAMSDMAVECATPGRFVVGHPFNPPYLIPLVEVVGGSRTEPGTVAWADEFYTLAGKVCLTMDA